MTDIEHWEVYKNFLENAHDFQSESYLPVELKLDLSTATVHLQLFIAYKDPWHKSVLPFEIYYSVHLNLSGSQ